MYVSVVLLCATTVTLQNKAQKQKRPLNSTFQVENFKQLIQILFSSQPFHQLNTECSILKVNVL